MWLSVLSAPECEAYRTHQFLWGYFPEQQNNGTTERPFCFRELDDQLLMLSGIRPAAPARQIELEAGRSLLFEMIASPRRGTYRAADGKRQRLPPMKSPRDMADWLRRRLDCAATVQFVDVKPLAPLSLRHADGNLVVLPQALFRGVLNVSDGERLRERMAGGIGQGGAFGLGMLLLPEVMRDG